MADVHERIDAYGRKSRMAKLTGGPGRSTAAAIAEEKLGAVFDEFHVTDIADAVRLRSAVHAAIRAWRRHGGDFQFAAWRSLQGQANRALFLPFVALLEKQCVVVRLDARIDFRLEKLTGMPTWYVPDDSKADEAIDEAWLRLTGKRTGTTQQLVVKGHAVRVPQAAMGVARFSFDDLCAQPLAASDYLKIAHEFHTIIVDHIPVMDYAQRNEAKRFIILIDTLYDNSVKLLASAAAQPDELYVATDGYEVNAVQANGLAPYRDAFPSLSWPAARSEAWAQCPFRENC